MSRRGDGVLLLHGLGRIGASLARMRAALDAVVYRTVSLDHPSIR